MTRDFHHGTWSVWSGINDQYVTFVGTYSGIADAMIQAVEELESESCVIVTDATQEAHFTADGFHPWDHDSPTVTIRLGKE
jgi:hypothetical protein